MARPFFIGDEFDFSGFGSSIIVGDPSVIQVNGTKIKPIAEGITSVFVYDNNGGSIEKFNIISIAPERPVDYLPGMGQKTRVLKIVNRLTNIPAIMAIIRLSMQSPWSLFNESGGAKIAYDGTWTSAEEFGTQYVPGGIGGIGNGYKGPVIEFALDLPIEDFDVTLPIVYDSSVFASNQITDLGFSIMANDGTHIASIVLSSINNNAPMFYFYHPGASSGWAAFRRTSNSPLRIKKEGGVFKYFDGETQMGSINAINNKQAVKIRVIMSKFDGMNVGVMKVGTPIA